MELQGENLVLKKDQFSVMKRLLRISGVSFYDNETLLYKIYSVVILSLNLYPFFQFIGMHRYLENPSETFEFFIFQTDTLIIFVKAALLVYKRDFMIKVFEKLQSGIFLPNTERGGSEELRLKIKCVRLMDIQAYVYWSFVTVIIIFAFFDSTYSRIVHPGDHHKWKFEFGKVTIFNTSYSPNYEIASLYQNISWFPIAWTFTMSDLLTVTVLAHIKCQLRMLQVFIRRITDNCYRRMERDRIPVSTHEDASQIPYRYLRQCLKEAVVYHTSVFDLAKDIEETFNFLILLIVLAGIVVIGSLLYQLNMLHFGGVCCFLFEIVLISYWGNEVSLESQNVMQALYDVKFYGTDVRFQKGLFIMMERTKRSIVITAGKFSPLTLGTFIWITRTSYSYLMILRRVNN